MRPTRSSSRIPATAPPADAGVEVIATNEQADQPVDIERWTLLATEALVDQGVTTGELNLLFIDRQSMTELNAEHMGEDGCTDVLSFPIDADGDDDLDALFGGPTLLGDIAICPAYAADQAPEHAGTYDDEIALLIVHGVLHILGMDHAEPEEAAEMQAAEQQLLTRYHQ